jgi:hypothetical protein
LDSSKKQKAKGNNSKRNWDKKLNMKESILQKSILKNAKSIFQNVSKDIDIL